MLARLMPIATNNMVIDHSHRLHKGIADCSAKKFKPTLAHIRTNFVR